MNWTFIVTIVSVSVTCILISALHFIRTEVGILTTDLKTLVDDPQEIITKQKCWENEQLFSVLKHLLIILIRH